MDRNIGTYVLSNASFKFYLTASLDERQKKMVRNEANEGTKYRVYKAEYS